MDEKNAWYLFETTGNIEAYMLYQELRAAPSPVPRARRAGTGRLYDADAAHQPPGVQM